MLELYYFSWFILTGATLADFVYSVAKNVPAFLGRLIFGLGVARDRHNASRADSDSETGWEAGSSQVEGPGNNTDISPSSRWQKD